MAAAEPVTAPQNEPCPPAVRPEPRKPVAWPGSWANAWRQRLKPRACMLSVCAAAVPRPLPFHHTYVGTSVTSSRWPPCAAWTLTLRDFSLNQRQCHRPT
eukprot:357241-Chlamydomonas_euryale.AAC.19